MQSQVELAKQQVRFMTLMPIEAEIELVVVKGHLLLEEQLTEILRLTINKDNPVGIEINPNMMFAQKLRLCWARNSSRQTDLFWSGMNQLNKIRNALAHNIEPKGIDSKIKNLTNAILPTSGFRPESYKGRELGCCIAWLYIILSTWAHELKNS